MQDLKQDEANRPNKNKTNIDHDGKNEDNDNNNNNNNNNNHNHNNNNTNTINNNNKFQQPSSDEVPIIIPSSTSLHFTNLNYSPPPPVS